jgi:ribose 5-phosphate isomerase B
MRIAVASDHAGFAAKEMLRALLEGLGHAVEDHGCASAEACDYPDFVIPAAEAVAAGRCERGFVLGGSGNGEAIAANKVQGIRAAVVTDAFTAEMARRHNDANVASFGTRVLPEEAIRRLAAAFLETPFDGGRHARRVGKIAAYERRGAARGG